LPGRIKPRTLIISLSLASLQAAEFWALGLEPIAVSAISGSGSGDLLDTLVATLPAVKPGQETAEPRDPPLAMAIIGRPNVGKSSLLNSLVGSERSIGMPSLLFLHSTIVS
jgi:GTP-binding protein